MREIKFRGKNIYTEEWIYGNLVNIEEDRYAVLPVINTMRGETIAMYEVNPETIGQFTGIKDKNCREIYEHDLIECGGILCEVVFNSHIGSFSLLEIFTQQLGSQPLGVMLDMFHASLKGNIHDNPELLKGGEK